MNKTIETIAPRLTELMVRKIESLTGKWHQPWIADMTRGLPRNLRGTPYRAGNVLTLFFLSEICGYRSPIFMTFRQAKDENLNICKGACSFPVYFWKMHIRHKETHEKIDLAEYYRLPQQQREQYDVMPVIRYYPVFNIDQTDLADKAPARYAELTSPSGSVDRSDGFTYAGIDALLVPDGWHCPIVLQYGNRASYSVAFDRIICPLKQQFPSGVDFYDTLLHEVAHSTGHPSRLNRPSYGAFGDSTYAREELLAELTSALCGAMLGLSVMPRAENAAYLKHWLAQLKQEPTYLFDILVDVNKAARMIIDKIKPDSDTEPDTEEDLQPNANV